MRRDTPSRPPPPIDTEPFFEAERSRAPAVGERLMNAVLRDALANLPAPAGPARRAPRRSPVFAAAGWVSGVRGRLATAVVFSLCFAVGLSLGYRFPLGVSTAEEWLLNAAGTAPVETSGEILDDVTREDEA